MDDLISCIEFYIMAFLVVASLIISISSLLFTTIKSGVRRLSQRQQLTDSLLSMVVITLVLIAVAVHIKGFSPIIILFVLANIWLYARESKPLNALRSGLCNRYYQYRYFNNKLYYLLTSINLMLILACSTMIAVEQSSGVVTIILLATLTLLITASYIYSKAPTGRDKRVVV